MSFTRYLRSDQRQKVYIILSLIGIILFFYSIWEIKPVIVDINDFLGMTSHLTVAYWIGLILMIVCSIFLYVDNELKDSLIFIYVLIMIALILFGLGIFSHDTVKNYTSYYPAGEVKNVLLTNKIDISSDIPLISYRSWPAFHIISAFLLYMTDIDFITMIKYMPLFWLLLFITIIFSIGKNFKFSSNQSYLLVLISLLSFWVSQYYYSPQSLAFLLYLLIFLLSIKMFINDNIDMTNKSILLVTFSAILIDHLLTTITVILSIMFILNRRIYKKIDDRLMFIIFLTLFIGWYIYLSPQVLKIGIPDFIEKVMAMESSSMVNTKFHPNSQAEMFSKIFQVTYIFIYIVLMIVSILNRFKIKEYKTVKFVLLWLSGIIFISIIAYGTETYERIYMFSIVPMVAIMIISFKGQRLEKRLFVSLIMIFAILFIPAHYGNESTSTGPQTELKGAEFFSLRINPQDPYFDSYYYDFDKYIYYFNPDTLIIRHQTSYKNYNYSLVDSTKYLINSRLTNNMLTFRYNFNPIQIWLYKNDAHLYLLYDNGYFNIYINKETTL